MKKAFTMIELIFVLIVIGILVAVILPSTRRNPLQEAAVQLLSHIRYTQHLALIDDKYDSSNTKWYKERWSIRFNSDANSNNQEAYTIFADTASTSTGNADLSEVALDPQNSTRVLSGGITGTTSLNINNNAFKGNKKMNLGLSYGVTSVTFNGGCTEKSFAFDHFGRPINSRLNGYTQAYKNNDLIQTTCQIILSNGSENVSIAIEPETGYSHII